MKKTTISKVKDGVRFKFNKRTTVIWELQTKRKGIATITTTISQVTRQLPVSTEVWVWPNQSGSYFA